MTKTVRRRLWRILYLFLTLCGALLVAAMLIPTLGGPHSRQVANEAATVSKLRAFSALQTNYLTSHPDKGFACELLLLVPQERVENDGYNPLRFLSAGTMSGYRFEIGDCSTDAKGLTAHYQVSAVPAERGVSGLRAFCTDESGLIWYDEVTKADRQRTVWLHDAQWSD